MLFHGLEDRRHHQHPTEGEQPMVMVLCLS
jgi:hypothetical protein